MKVFKTILRALLALILIIIIFAAGVLIYFVIPQKGSLPEYIFSKTDLYDDSKAACLTKEDGRDFKILQFTDVHFVIGFGFDNKAAELIRRAAEEAVPDLIVFSGDQCFTPFNTGMYKKLTKLMGEIGVPWAFVFGNHDETGPGDKARLANIAMEDKNCLFAPGPTNIQGTGNYVINIKNKAGENVWSVFMLDSNSSRDYRDAPDVENGTKGYDYIYPDQIEWYEWAVSGIAARAGKTVPSVLFTHIPLPEYSEAYDKALNGGDASLIYGERGEKECPPQFNTGLFEKMVQLGSTKAMFCGHDHLNDYCVKYKGVKLAYGLSSGYGSYGNKHDKGATLITIKDDLTLSIEKIVINQY